MGNIFCQKRQVIEELEEIVNCLNHLEKQIKKHVKNRSYFLRTLVYIWIVVFTVLTSYIWLHFFQIIQRTFAILFTFIVTIFIFFMLRLALISLYDYVILQKQKKIQFYIERKLKIIEDVKENEKFKIAKEIIEKYSSKDDLHKLNAENKTTNSKLEDNIKFCDSQFEKNLSNLSKKSSYTTRYQPSCTTSTHTQVAISSSNSIITSEVPKLHEISDLRHSYKPIRPFIKENKNPLDRILDYVLGESINNRYALICRHCQTHNGMALQEEFDQLSFFCYKCITYNASRNENNAAFSISHLNNSSLTSKSNNFEKKQNKTKSSRTSSISSRSTIESIENASYNKKTESIIKPNFVSTAVKSTNSLTTNE